MELELVEIQLKLKMYLHLNLVYTVMLDGDYKKEKKILFTKLQQKVLTQVPLAEMLGIIAMYGKSLVYNTFLVSLSLMHSDS